jgi:hypothetical protein
MYKLRRSWRGLPRPSRKRIGFGALRTTGRWMRSGCCMASSQASAPPQSCPATAAEPAPKATIRSATSWASTLGR